MKVSGLLQTSKLYLQDGDYARMNSLTTELVERLFDDVTTSHEAFLRGVRISGNNNNTNTNNNNNNNKNNNNNQGGYQALEIREFSIYCAEFSD